MISFFFLISNCYFKECICLFWSSESSLRHFPKNFVKVKLSGVNLKMIVLVTAFLPILIPTIVSAALDLSLLLHCYPCFQKIIFAIFQGCYAESSSADSLPDSYGETGHHIT